MKSLSVCLLALTALCIGLEIYYMIEGDLAKQLHWATLGVFNWITFLRTGD